MKIITAYPVIMDRKVIANKFAANTMNFSSFDANGKPVTKAEIQSFQNWLDVKYPTWLNGGKLNKGSGYGTFGPSTTNAWTNYGSGFVADMKALSGTLAQTFTPTSNTVPATDTSAAQQEKMKKLGYFLDRAKGVYTKAKELGFLDGILNRLGLGGATTQQESAPIITTTTETPPPSGMSTTTKVLIGVGVAAVLITILVVATKSKEKGK